MSNSIAQSAPSSPKQCRKERKHRTISKLRDMFRPKSLPEIPQRGSTSSPLPDSADLGHESSPAMTHTDDLKLNKDSLISLSLDQTLPAPDKDRHQQHDDVIVQIQPEDSKRQFGELPILPSGQSLGLVSTPVRVEVDEEGRLCLPPYMRRDLSKESLESGYRSNTNSQISLHSSCRKSSTSSYTSTRDSTTSLFSASSDDKAAKISTSSLECLKEQSKESFQESIPEESIEGAVVSHPKSGGRSEFRQRTWIKTKSKTLLVIRVVERKHGLTRYHTIPQLMQNMDEFVVVDPALVTSVIERKQKDEEKDTPVSRGVVLRPHPGNVKEPKSLECLQAECSLNDLDEREMWDITDFLHPSIVPRLATYLYISADKVAKIQKEYASPDHQAFWVLKTWHDNTTKGAHNRIKLVTDLYNLDKKRLAEMVSLNRYVCSKK